MIMRSAAMRRIQGLIADDGGATMIEYALIISLISIAIGFLIPDIRASIDSLFLQTASGLTNAAAGAVTP